VIKSRKFRSALAGAVAVVALFAVAGSGEEEASSGGDSAASSADSVSSGLGSADASADVTAVTLLPPDAIGVSYVEVTIVNNSSKASDYFVTLTADSADGTTRYDETIVSVMGLEPGQTTIEKGIFTADIPVDAVVTVKEVQRTAST